MSARIGTGATALLVCVACGLGAAIGNVLPFPHTGTAILYPPFAIVTTALLLSPPRRWWIYLLASSVGTVVAHRLSGDPVSFALMTEVANYARALLLERKDPRKTLRFVTRDTTVRVGRLITVNTAQPPISGTFRVQRISFDEIAISGGLARTDPRRTVEASNKLFTFADLLRRLRGREGGAQ